MTRGSCLCGAVRFEVHSPLRMPDACHCTACRKQSGHYWVSGNVPREAFVLSADQGLRWYQSSDEVRRGFCSICGSSLFWDPIRHPFIAVAMGALDDPSGTQLAKHIFVADKGDYYELTDGLPQKPHH